MATSPPRQGDSAPAVSAVLTRKKLSVYLDRPLPTLDKDIAGGRIPEPCFRLLRSPRWRRDVIDAWMAAGAPSRDEWEAMQRHGDGKRR